jgi:hypothetical protein
MLALLYMVSVTRSIAITQTAIQHLYTLDVLSFGGGHGAVVLGFQAAALFARPFTNGLFSPSLPLQ